MSNYRALINTMSRGNNYSPRTQAFATASGISDTSILNPLSVFDLGLISDGIIPAGISLVGSKIQVMLTLVGGTASTHKWNFMDPQDTDAAFRLVFSGGWTHSSTGALPNGTNGFAYIFYHPSTDCASQNSTSIGYYSRTDNTNTGYEIGGGGGTPRTSMAIRWAGTFYQSANAAELGGYANASSLGLHIVSRIDASNVVSYIRNTKTSVAQASSGRTADMVLLSALGQNAAGTALYFTDKECAFAFIGTGLTDTDAGNLYTRIQTLQTSLGRQV